MRQNKTANLCYIFVKLPVFKKKIILIKFVEKFFAQFPFVIDRKGSKTNLGRKQKRGDCHNQKFVLLLYYFMHKRFPLALSYTIFFAVLWQVLLYETEREHEYQKHGKEKSYNNY
ncbi:MAG: hypothetical protein BWY90_01736 [Deltaproteobacteria bacterium ADurb.BinA014]|nr:MAG: hypothetical protein BWY90_01736 [Deltaproteobacteria bacterium ADurb.BinA014]